LAERRVGREQRLDGGGDGVPVFEVRQRARHVAQPLLHAGCPAVGAGERGALGVCGGSVWRSGVYCLELAWTLGCRGGQEWIGQLSATSGPNRERRSPNAE
jgi:hypothetical protein